MLPPFSPSLHVAGDGTLTRNTSEEKCIYISSGWVDSKGAGEWFQEGQFVSEDLAEAPRGLSKFGLDDNLSRCIKDSGYLCCRKHGSDDTQLGMRNVNQ